MALDESWKNVKTLFLEALEKDPSDRRSFLEAMCRGNDTLLQDVESLVSAHEDAGTFIEKPPVVGESGLLEAITGTWALGRQIGNYRLRAHLGRGALGNVFLGHSVKGGGSPVALELLSPEASAAGAFERVAELEESLQGLRNPHLARFLSSGTTPEGLPYLVSEFVDGVHVDRFADSRRLDVERRVDLLAQACEGVEAAHGMGLLHLDLKPRNAVVGQDGDVIVRDLGLTSLLTDTLGTELLTLPAMTTPYTSPEQVAGERVGTHSDVWALGVLLFELLTGRHPFLEPGDRPQDLPRWILVANVKKASAVVVEGEGRSSQEIAALRGSTPQGLSDRLGGPFDDLFQKVLVPRPQDRLATVSELRRSLMDITG